MLEPSTLGGLGYLLAALLMGVLCALLLTTWRGRLQGGLLLFAVAASCLWAALLMAQVVWQSVPSALIWVAESLRILAWLLFLVRLLDVFASRGTSYLRLLRWGVLGACVLLSLPFEASLQALLPALSSQVGSLRLIVLVVLMVTGLFLVEQIYRNTPWQHRWGIKFLCFGLGALFAYDFYFFADALLFGRVDYGLLLARGAINAFVVPLLAVSAARNPQWSFDLVVSRSFVIHSTTLIAAGVYLLFMSFAGYYIRYYGGEWSSLFQPLFFFGAGLLLLVLLFSGQLRSRLKVFINKHFFSYRYDYREEWLRLIRVLSGKVLQASLPERIIFALCELVESPGGAIWIRSEDGDVELGRCWNMSETSVDARWDAQTFCEALRRSTQVIDIASDEPPARVAPGLAVPAWMLRERSLWLIVPLFHEDQLVGFVILAKPRAPQPLDWETEQLLQTAARQAASYLVLDQAATALAQARQFEGFNRLSAFVVHDLKNLVAQLSLITRNAERYKQNQAFVDDAFETVGSAVARMSRLLAQLRAAAASQSAALVRLRGILDDVVAERAVAEPRPALEILDDADPLVSADADRLRAVIANVVQNAQEATPRSGHVTVRLGLRQGSVQLEVEDTGCGMDEEFLRTRLFRPFDSTKGLSGMGIGAYECREFVTMLGGRVEVDSEPGAGTRFRISIPAADGTEASAPTAVSA